MEVKEPHFGNIIGNGNKSWKTRGKNKKKHVKYVSDQGQDQTNSKSPVELAEKRRLFILVIFSTVLSTL